jgi:predicted transcriptional regulator
VDRDSLTLLLAQGVSVEQIGRRFGKHPSTISYWMNKFGLMAPNREKHLAKGGIERERLEALVAEGMTTRDMAAELECSQVAVRYWLGKHGLRTLYTERRAAARGAREAGKATVQRTCDRHGETEYVLDYSGCYRCKRCRAERVAKRRRKLKELLVRDAGGRCCLCGYDRYVGALEFHHVNPSEKQLSISNYGTTASLERLREEATKCVLVCSNCHAEVEAGVTRLDRPRGSGSATMNRAQHDHT